MDKKRRLEELEIDIKKLRDKLAELESEEWEIKESMNGYYIGKIRESSEYNDRITYYTLGFRGEDSALNWVSNANEGLTQSDYYPYVQADYFQVSEKEHVDYMYWELASRAREALDAAEDFRVANYPSESMEKLVYTENERMAKKLGHDKYYEEIGNGLASMNFLCWEDERTKWIC